MLSLLFAAASYWTAHIDFPANRTQFERIDARFNAAIQAFYTAHNLTPPTVWRLVTGDGAYIGLRPRGTLADLATPQLPADLSKELNASTAPISEATHQILRAHHSELWRLEPDLTTRRDDALPRKYSTMRVDIVSPPRNDAYEKAMKQLVLELAANGVETIGFFSTYGDGGYHYIFSSDKPIRVRSVKGFGETRDAPITALEIRSSRAIQPPPRQRSSS
jgi:hypothetical protein